MARGKTKEETLQNIKAEIRFWIEIGPCGIVSEDHVAVEIMNEYKPICRKITVYPLG